MKTAIVGCGAIAQVHAGVLSRLDTSLIACADIVPARAQAMAEKYGARAYASLAELLGSETPDVLHILTPHALHTPMAEEAAARGIAVFMEKPPVVSRAQWARLEAAARRVPVGVCFQNRYNPATGAAKALLQSGDAGRVLGARAFVTWQRGADYYTDSGWRGTWALEGGGVLINQAVHTLDLMVYLLGKPTACAAAMQNRHLHGAIEVEDTVEARVAFGDAVGLFYASTGYCQDAPILLEIACERAAVRLEGGTSLEVRWKDGRVDTTDYGMGGVLGKGYWGNGHYPCIADFYRCLREGAPFPVGVSDVKDTMLLLLDMYQKGGMAPGDL